MSRRLLPLQQVEAFFDVHEEMGTVPGGLHLEMTGDNVTECIGGGSGVTGAEGACLPRQLMVTQGQHTSVSNQHWEFTSALTLRHQPIGRAFATAFNMLQNMVLHRQDCWVWDK